MYNQQQQSQYAQQHYSYRQHQQLEQQYEEVETREELGLPTSFSNNNNNPSLSSSNYTSPQRQKASHLIQNNNNLNNVNENGYYYENGHHHNDQTVSQSPKSYYDSSPQRQNLKSVASSPTRHFQQQQQPGTKNSPYHSEHYQPTSHENNSNFLNNNKNNDTIDHNDGNNYMYGEQGYYDEDVQQEQNGSQNQYDYSNNYDEVAYDQPLNGSGEYGYPDNQQQKLYPQGQDESNHLSYEKIQEQQQFGEENYNQENQELNQYDPNGNYLPEELANEILLPEQYQEYNYSQDQALEYDVNVDYVSEDQAISQEGQYQSQQQDQTLGEGNYNYYPQDVQQEAEYNDPNGTQREGAEYNYSQDVQQEYEGYDHSQNQQQGQELVREEDEQQQEQHIDVNQETSDLSNVKCNYSKESMFLDDRTSSSSFARSSSELLAFLNFSSETNYSYDVVPVMTNIVTSLKWTISNWDNYTQDDKLVSPTFGPENWRWQAIIYPRGAGDGLGSHLSAFLRPLLNCFELENHNTWSRPIQYFSYGVRANGPDQDIFHSEASLASFMGFNSQVSGWGFQQFLPLENVTSILDNSGSLHVDVEVSGKLTVQVASCAFALKVPNGLNSDSFTSSPFGPDKCPWALHLVKEEHAQDGNYCYSAYLIPSLTAVENSLGKNYNRFISSFSLRVYKKIDSSEVNITLESVKTLTGGFNFTLTNSQCGWTNVLKFDANTCEDNAVDSLVFVEVTWEVDGTFNKLQNVFSDKISDFEETKRLLNESFSRCRQLEYEITSHESEMTATKNYLEEQKTTAIESKRLLNTAKDDMNLLREEIASLKQHLDEQKIQKMSLQEKLANFIKSSTICRNFARKANEELKLLKSHEGRLTSALDNERGHNQELKKQLRAAKNQVKKMLGMMGDHVQLSRDDVSGVQTAELSRPVTPKHHIVLNKAKVKIETLEHTLKVLENDKQQLSILLKEQTGVDWNDPDTLLSFAADDQVTLQGESSMSSSKASSSTNLSSENVTEIENSLKLIQDEISNGRQTLEEIKLKLQPVDLPTPDSDQQPSMENETDDRNVEAEEEEGDLGQQRLNAEMEQHQESSSIVKNHTGIQEKTESEKATFLAELSMLLAELELARAALIDLKEKSLSDNNAAYTQPNSLLHTVHQESFEQTQDELRQLKFEIQSYVILLDPERQTEFSQLNTSYYDDGQIYDQAVEYGQYPEYNEQYQQGGEKIDQSSYDPYYYGQDANGYTDNNVYGSREFYGENTNNQYGSSEQGYSEDEGGSYYLNEYGQYSGNYGDSGYPDPHSNGNQDDGMLAVVSEETNKDLSDEMDYMRQELEASRQEVRRLSKELGNVRSSQQAYDENEDLPTEDSYSHLPPPPQFGKSVPQQLQTMPPPPIGHGNSITTSANALRQRHVPGASFSSPPTKLASSNQNTDPLKAESPSSSNTSGQLKTSFENGAELSKIEPWTPVPNKRYKTKLVKGETSALGKFMFYISFASFITVFTITATHSICSSSESELASLISNEEVAKHAVSLCKEYDVVSLLSPAHKMIVDSGKQAIDYGKSGVDFAFEQSAELKRGAQKMMKYADEYGLTQNVYIQSVGTFIQKFYERGDQVHHNNNHQGIWDHHNQMQEQNQPKQQNTPEKKENIEDISFSSPPPPVHVTDKEQIVDLQEPSVHYDGQLPVENAKELHIQENIQNQIQDIPRVPVQESKDIKDEAIVEQVPDLSKAAKLKEHQLEKNEEEEDLPVVEQPKQVEAVAEEKMAMKKEEVNIKVVPDNGMYADEEEYAINQPTGDQIHSSPGMDQHQQQGQQHEHKKQSVEEQLQSHKHAENVQQYTTASIMKKFENKIDIKQAEEINEGRKPLESVGTEKVQKERSLDQAEKVIEKKMTNTSAENQTQQSLTEERKSGEDLEVKEQYIAILNQQSTNQVVVEEQSKEGPLSHNKEQDMKIEQQMNSPKNEYKNVPEQREFIEKRNKTLESVVSSNQERSQNQVQLEQQPLEETKEVIREPIVEEIKQVDQTEVEKNPSIVTVDHEKSGQLVVEDSNQPVQKKIISDDESHGVPVEQQKNGQPETVIVEKAKEAAPQESKEEKPQNIKVVAVEQQNIPIGKEDTSPSSSTSENIKVGVEQKQPANMKVKQVETDSNPLVYKSGENIGESTKQKQEPKQVLKADSVNDFFDQEEDQDGDEIEEGEDSIQQDRIDKQLNEEQDEVVEKDQVADVPPVAEDVQQDRFVEIDTPGRKDDSSQERQAPKVPARSSSSTRKTSYVTDNKRNNKNTFAVNNNNGKVKRTRPGSKNNYGMPPSSNRPQPQDVEVESNESQQSIQRKKFKRAAPIDKPEPVVRGSNPVAYSAEEAEFMMPEFY